jgi:predicted Zn-dependent protease
MASPKRVSKLLAALLATASLSAAPRAFAGDQAPPIIRDTEIEEILHKEVAPVIAASGLNANDVHIYIVGDNEINAESAGGQNIFIFTGLLEETENPNQLIGVVAHEAGHISGGHLVRNEMRDAGMKPFLLTMGLGILAAAAGNGGAAAAAIMSAPQMGALGSIGYSRSQEGAADQAAATSLEKAGISGKGIVDFFDKYRYEEVFDNARRDQYFIDHPLSEDRIEALRRRVESAPHYGETDSAEAIKAHELMKAKLAAFMQAPQLTFNKYPASDTSFIARYARAIAYYQATEPQEAVKQIDALIKDYPDDPYLYELKGQVLFESSRAAEAEAAHRRSVELKPGAPLLLINLSQCLIVEGKPAQLDEAVEDLHKALGIENGDDAVAWRLLSQAYDAKNMPGEARLAAAEEHFNLGQLRDAKSFAMRAREMLKRNTPEWRRATDIVLVAATPEDVRELSRADSGQQ